MWQEALIAIGAPALRSAVGWLEKASKDGQYTYFEFKELGVTIFRMSILNALAYSGMSELGFDPSILLSTVAAYFFDIVWREGRKVIAVLKAKYTLG